MPTKYVRKAGSTRGQWTEETLKNAINAVQNNGLSVNRASINFGIPRKTLERRIKENNDIKGKLGPDCVLGKANERKLVSHIKKMQKYGFPLNRDDLRRIAYHFAEQLNVKHKFNRNEEKAGYDWLRMFLCRNPDLSIRKSEGVSISRAIGMNRLDVAKYFELLQAVLTDHELIGKPGSLFNMDESGLQLNNKTGEVIAQKGSKDVSTITSAEKGETITCIACCNAEGAFLPPCFIMKGKNKKREYEDGMPPGSILYMSEKSAYINTNIFLNWMQEQFLPRKPNGPVVLLLDGHTSHSNSVEVLEFADRNNIVMLCLPPHTTHYLQPLDRSFFKSLKAFFYESCRKWIRNNPGRKITRLQFGQLISEAWSKSATPSNAISGFRECGVFPLNENCVPEHAFAISDIQQPIVNNIATIANDNGATIYNVFDREPVEPPNLSDTSQENNNDSVSATVTTAVPSTSKANTIFLNSITNEPSSSKEKSTVQITPGKLLNQLAPVPQLINKVRKRAQSVATILTSSEHIEDVKKKQLNKQGKSNVKKNNNRKLKTKIKKRKHYSSSSSSEESDIEIADDEDEDIVEEDENECAGCGEEYRKTKKKEDWLQCVNCSLWSHENCTPYENLCNRCGKIITKKKK